MSDDPFAPLVDRSAPINGPFVLAVQVPPTAQRAMAPIEVRVFALTIPGEPVAKGRGRIIKMGAHMGIKTPDKTRRYEDIIRQTAVREWGYRQPLRDVAVTITVRAYRGIAASWPKKKALAALNETLRPLGRPDADNYVKSALDGMIGVVLADDSLVVDLHVTKWYAAEPRLEIVVTW